jgi:hypothetical protein
MNAPTHARIVEVGAFGHADGDPAVEVWRGSGWQRITSTFPNFGAASLYCATHGYTIVPHDWTPPAPDVAALVAAAVAGERERCAALCDAFSEDAEVVSTSREQDVLVFVAKVIRDGAIRSGK